MINRGVSKAKARFEAENPVKETPMEQGAFNLADKFNDRYGKKGYLTDKYVSAIEKEMEVLSQSKVRSFEQAKQAKLEFQNSMDRASEPVDRERHGVVNAMWNSMLAGVVNLMRTNLLGKGKEELKAKEADVEMPGWLGNVLSNTAVGRNAQKGKTTKLSKAVGSSASDTLDKTEEFRANAPDRFKATEEKLNDKANIEELGWLGQRFAEAAGSLPASLATRIPIVGWVMMFNQGFRNSLEESAERMKLTGEKFTTDQIAAKALANGAIEVGTEMIFPMFRKVGGLKGGTLTNATKGLVDYLVKKSSTTVAKEIVEKIGGNVGKGIIANIWNNALFQVPKQITRQGLEESAEEGLNLVGNAVVARFTTDKNAKLFTSNNGIEPLITLAALSRVMTTGFISGGTMTAVRTTPQYLSQIRSASTILDKPYSKITQADLDDLAVHASEVFKKPINEVTNEDLRTLARIAEIKMQDPVTSKKVNDKVVEGLAKNTTDADAKKVADAVRVDNPDLAESIDALIKSGGKFKPSEKLTPQKVMDKVKENESALNAVDAVERPKKARKGKGETIAPAQSDIAVEAPVEPQAKEKTTEAVKPQQPVKKSASLNAEPAEELHKKLTSVQWQTIKGNKYVQLSSKAGTALPHRQYILQADGSLRVGDVVYPQSKIEDVLGKEIADKIQAADKGRHDFVQATEVKPVEKKAEPAKKAEPEKKAEAPSKQKLELKNEDGTYNLANLKESRRRLNLAISKATKEQSFRMKEKLHALDTLIEYVEKNPDYVEEREPKKVEKKAEPKIEQATPEEEARLEELSKPKKKANKAETEKINAKSAGKAQKTETKTEKTADKQEIVKAEPVAKEEKTLEEENPPKKYTAVYKDNDGNFRERSGEYRSRDAFIKELKGNGISSPVVIADDIAETYRLYDQDRNLEISAKMSEVADFLYQNAKLTRSAEQQEIILEEKKAKDAKEKLEALAKPQPKTKANKKVEPAPAVEVAKVAEPEAKAEDPNARPTPAQRVENYFKSENAEKFIMYTSDGDEVECDNIIQQDDKGIYWMDTEGKEHTNSFASLVTRLKAETLVMTEEPSDWYDTPATEAPVVEVKVAEVKPAREKANKKYAVEADPLVHSGRFSLKAINALKHEAYVNNETIIASQWTEYKDLQDVLRDYPNITNIHTLDALREATRMIEIRDGGLLITQIQTADVPNAKERMAMDEKLVELKDPKSIRDMDKLKEMIDGYKAKLKTETDKKTTGIYQLALEEAQVEYRARLTEQYKKINAQKVAPVVSTKTIEQQLDEALKEKMQLQTSLNSMRSIKSTSELNSMSDRLVALNGEIELLREQKYKQVTSPASGTKRPDMNLIDKRLLAEVPAGSFITLTKIDSRGKVTEQTSTITVEDLLARHSAGKISQGQLKRILNGYREQTVAESYILTTPVITTKPAKAEAEVKPEKKKANKKTSKKVEAAQSTDIVTELLNKEAQRKIDLDAEEARSDHFIHPAIRQFFVGSLHKNKPTATSDTAWEKAEPAHMTERIEKAQTLSGDDSFLVNLSNKYNEMREKITLGSVPIEKKFADIRQRFRESRASGMLGSRRAIDILNMVYGNIPQEKLKLLSRAILYFDIVSDINRGLYGEKTQIQFGATPEEVFNVAYEIALELQRTDEKGNLVNQDVIDAMNTRKLLMNSLREKLIREGLKAGLDLSRITALEDYMLHSVTEFNAEFGENPWVKRNSNGSLAYLGRTGSDMDYVSDPVMADFLIMTKFMRDTTKLKLWNAVAQQDIKDTLEKDEQGRQKIPKGYAEMDPSFLGINNFLESNRTAVVASTMMTLEKLKIKPTSKEGMKRIARAMKYADKHSIVVPEQIVRAMKYEFTRREKNGSKLGQKIMSAWKYTKLRLPGFVWKYNVRNLFGDLDAVMMGDPAAMKYIPRAVRELYDYYYKYGKTSMNLQDFIDRTGLVTGEVAQTLKKLTKSRALAFYQKEETGAQLAVRGIKGAWRVLTMETTTQFREQVLRYAEYLSASSEWAISEFDVNRKYTRGDTVIADGKIYDCIQTYNPDVQTMIVPTDTKYWKLSKKRNTQGLPVYYASSNPVEIQNLSDIKDRAAKFANDLVGAYDDVSVFGQYTADHLIPFFRFKEVNIRRYYRMIRNTWYKDPYMLQTASNDVLSSLGKGARVGAFTAFRMGKLALSAGAYYGAQILFNKLIMGKEEEKLPEDVQNSSHITLPEFMFQDGRVHYIDRIGSASEFVSIFGIDGSIEDDLQDLIAGRITWDEKLREMLMLPVYDTLNSMHPIMKMSLELVMGKQLYPDPSNPVNIRDRGEYVFSQFGLKDEYNALKGKPLPQGSFAKQRMSTLLANVVIPGDAAYWDINDVKNTFYKVNDITKMYSEYKDKTTSAYKRSQAAYYYKVALKLEDTRAAEKYLAEYIMYGGTQSKMNQSLASMHPLYGMTNAEKDKFLDWLNPDERKDYDTAVKYYEDIIASR